MPSLTWTLTVAGEGPARTPGRSSRARGRSRRDPAALLTAARQALDGQLSLPAGRRTRAAAVLARTALEGIIDDRLAEVGAQKGATGTSVEAGVRVKLICLRVFDGDGVAARAAWAFSALSTACHQHAYDLAPSVREVGHLIETVEDLLIGRAEGAKAPAS